MRFTVTISVDFRASPLGGLMVEQAPSRQISNDRVVAATRNDSTNETNWYS
jgi:hypothetical protein